MPGQQHVARPLLSLMNCVIATTLAQVTSALDILNSFIIFCLFHLIHWHPSSLLRWLALLLFHHHHHHHPHHHPHLQLHFDALAKKWTCFLPPLKSCSAAQRLPIDFHCTILCLSTAAPMQKMNLSWDWCWGCLHPRAAEAMCSLLRWHCCRRLHRQTAKSDRID